MHLAVDQFHRRLAARNAFLSLDCAPALRRDDSTRKNAGRDATCHMRRITLNTRCSVRQMQRKRVDVDVDVDVVR